MKTEFFPKGVCSRKMEIEIEDGIIKNLNIIGGCSGNLQGICRLSEGKRPEEVIAALKGIKCGYKPTSCPDQLAIALEKAITEEKS